MKVTAHDFIDAVAGVGAFSHAGFVVMGKIIMAPYETNFLGAETHCVT